MPARPTWETIRLGRMLDLRKVVLVEFAAVDRFHRAIAFPFIKGSLQEKGIECLWLRLGVQAEKAMAPDGTGVQLGEEEIGTLLGHLAKIDGGLVVFSMLPAAGVLERIAGRCRPGAVVSLSDAGMGETAAGRASRTVEILSEQELLSKLGIDAKGNLFEDVVPDFHYLPANRAAAEAPPLPFLMIGRECSYSRAYAGNDFLKDLGNGRQRGGCSFCMRPAEGGRWKGNPVILFERQFRAMVDTVPDANLPLAVRVVGEQAMLHIEAIANRTLKIAPFEVELLLDCRPDSLLRWENRLRRALGKLGRASSGHRIELCLLGVENFSSRELEIYNKGLTPSDNLRAIGLLHKLESQYPRHFGFRKYGGLSMITYNPWTRPRDLALNLAVVQMLGIENLCGKLLGGRLRLYPKLPLFRKAKVNGLLRRRYGDRLLDTASRNMYAREVPWRFENPRMESICSKLVRLETVTEKAEGHGKVPEALDIVDTELAASKAAGRKRGRQRKVPQRAIGKDTLSGIQASCEVKPVCLVEPVGSKEAERLLGSGLVQNPLVRRKGTAQGGFELFCGKRRRDVLRAAHLAEQIEKAPPGRLKGLMRRMGRLLGYPDCCSVAFSSLHPGLIDDNFYLRVLRRIESPGGVSWKFNPGGNPLLEYIPCSLECAASLSRFERMARAWKRHAGLDLSRLRMRLSHPTLIFKQMQDCFVELIPRKVREESGGSFLLKYSPGQHSGRSRLLEGVLRGDTLVVEPECMAVLRGGKEIAALSGRAYLWWHKRAFQVEFWRSLLETVPYVGKGHGRLASHKAGAVQQPADADALKLARQLEKLRLSGSAYNGYAIERVTTLGGGKVRIVFSNGSESFALELERAVPGKPFFLRAAGLIMTYPNSMPIRSENQKLAAAAFAGSLRNLLRWSPGREGEATS